MAVAAMPRPISELNTANPGQKQTAPLASLWESFFALPAKLISQRLLLPVFMTKDNRAKFSVTAVVSANNLLIVFNCFCE